MRVRYLLYWSFDESHYHDTIYRAHDKDLNSKIKKVLKDGLKLYLLYRKDNKISHITIDH